MKKILCGLMLSILCLNTAAFAKEIPNVSAVMTEIDAKEYKHKTVRKHYNVYNLKITNKNTKAVLLSSDTEVSFISDYQDDVTSATRREQYRNSRKRDMGRYYGIALPGALLSGCITVATLFIGSPVAAAVFAGMYLPTDKAVRTNVAISQDLFAENALPIRFEPNQTYNVRVLVPNDIDVNGIVFSNVSYDLKEMYELHAKVEEL